MSNSDILHNKPYYTITDVVTYSDYLPFGSQMTGRHGSISSYRYGMGGQEKDDEIAGEGNSYTAEFWQYDSRIGRRWNTDPVVKHHESPYACFANNPIWFIDPSGADTLNGNKVLPTVKKMNEQENTLNKLRSEINDQIKGRNEILEKISSIEDMQSICDFMKDFNPVRKNSALKSLTKAIETHIEGNEKSIDFLKATFIAMEFSINENITEYNALAAKYNENLLDLQLDLKFMDNDDNMFIGGKKNSVFLEQNKNSNKRALFRLEVNGDTYRFGTVNNSNTKSLIVKLNSAELMKYIRPSFELLGISPEDAFRALPDNVKSEEKMKKNFKNFYRKMTK